MIKTTVKTPVGPLLLVAEDEYLVKISFNDPVATSPPVGVLCLAETQLNEYFHGNRKHFSIPHLRPAAATPFQNRVWDALEAIPFGETKNYGDLAAELATSPRAVGGACARNALPLIIPCHRVVAASGLGGFCGEWETGIVLQAKKGLLVHESACGL